MASPLAASVYLNSMDQKASLIDGEKLTKT